MSPSDFIFRKDNPKTPRTNVLALSLSDAVILADPRRAVSRCLELSRELEAALTDLRVKHKLRKQQELKVAFDTETSEPKYQGVVTSRTASSSPNLQTLPMPTPKRLNLKKPMQQPNARPHLRSLKSPAADEIRTVLENHGQPVRRIFTNLNAQRTQRRIKFLLEHDAFTFKALANLIAAVAAKHGVIVERHFWKDSTTTFKYGLIIREQVQHVEFVCDF